MISAFLQGQNISAIYYHAGVENDDRRSIEQRWMQNGYKVVCSTNALGMGIDKPDIRFVIHYDVPGSPIHYYQEIGRAGRDGQQSRCILIQNYAASGHCYAGFLTAYLGDPPGYECGVCGYCRPVNFPQIAPSQRIQQAITQFLEKDFLPSIQKKSSQRNPGHEAGFSLSYHSNSRIGGLVRHSKYENGGPFPDELVTRAVEVIRMHYPMQAIDGIVSVPPTKSGALVEDFARRVASRLGIQYLPIVSKVGITGEQKNFTNSVQKEENVKNAFSVTSPELVSERTLLLIDDIYDSGYTMREVARTLMKADAKAIYPFTITRTRHSDDQ